MVNFPASKFNHKVFKPSLTKNMERKEQHLPDTSLQTCEVVRDMKKQKYRSFQSVEFSSLSTLHTVCRHISGRFCSFLSYLETFQIISSLWVFHLHSSKFTYRKFCTVLISEIVSRVRPISFKMLMFFYHGFFIVYSYIRTVRPMIKWLKFEHCKTDVIRSK